MNSQSQRLCWSAILPILCMALLLMVSSLAQSESEEDAVQDIRFNWSFGAYSNDSTTLTSVTQDTTLNSGSSFKLLFEPKTPGYFRLLYQDSSGDLSWLYQKDIAQEESLPGITSIPAQDKWFELDHEIGKERFFILASTEPLAALDQVMNQYGTASPENKERLKAAVLDEVRAIYKAKWDLSKQAEQPVIIGGSIRGTYPEELKSIAVSAQAKDFYGKTITIDHQ